MNKSKILKRLKKNMLKQQINQIIVEVNMPHKIKDQNNKYMRII